MKLAIKGHSTKGKEVIEVLEMLGGINKQDYNGRSERLVYYINSEGIITTSWTEGDSYCLTLEEFKELCPYKIGDEVCISDHLLPNYVQKVLSNPFEIISIEWNTTLNTLYCDVKKDRTIFMVKITSLTPYKPMKKETKTLADYLKPGYVIEYDDGLRFVITQDVHGNNFGLQLGAAIMWASLDALDSIVKVYQIDRPGALHKTFDQNTRLTLVWEKPKEVELTMQEIADKFGIDVNQLRIKK